jgi:DNA-binding response OmpR family regulator
LLSVLLRNRGRVLTREFIAECLSGGTDPVRGRTIDVQIARLRKKLGSDRRRLEIIRSVRGVGYVLMCG